MNELPIGPAEVTGPHIPKPSEEIIPAMPGPPGEPLKVRVPFYYRDGFKRLMGLLSVGAGIAALFPNPAVQAIGQGLILLIGGYLTAVGVKDAADKKSSGKEPDTKLHYIMEIIAKLWQWYKKTKGIK